MQKNLINDITTSSKIIALMFTIITLLIAKSIFLIVFITILTIIIMTLVDKSVKFYVLAVQKAVFWLLFFLIAYIIVFGDIVGSIYLLYKLILCTMLLTCFILNVNFSQLIDGIYTLMLPVGKFVPDISKKAYNIAKFLYLYIFLKYDDNKIIKSQQIKNKIRVNIKCYFIPRMFYAFDKVTKLENELVLNFYSVKKEKNSILSLTFVVMSLFLCVFAVFKEVIL